MKRTILIAILCTFTLGIMAQTEETSKEKETVVFNVYMDGHCCIDDINEGVGFEKGVKNVVCDLEKQTVKVTYRKDKTDVETIVKAFAKAGKKATLVKEEKKE